MREDDLKRRAETEAMTVTRKDPAVIERLKERAEAVGKAEEALDFQMSYRNAAVVAAYKNGHSLRDIGQAIGRSAQAVWNIVEDAEQREKETVQVA